MKIYLDIDGVLLANESSLAEHAEEFLDAVLQKYPDSTYWLTTHCWQGENEACAVLLPLLPDDLKEKIKLIKPTEWGEWKTEAIDFTQPFLWFDDDLYPEEENALKAHNKLGSYVKVDLFKDPGQLKELIHIL